ncbi:MAG: polyribonucleotide nucleotidyltransferase [Rickettsiales bacterium]
MFKIISKEIEWAGSKLKIETGKIARQADGAVMVSYGETMVLCTVVSDKKKKEGIDFLPLTVHYKEMFFAAGKIPGGFFKREGKATEKETLVSRLIDRPIRPLFPDCYYHETQIICTVLSFDNSHDSDILAVIGSAAALAISRIPFGGPLAAAKVGYKDGEYILNPRIGCILTEGDLDLVVAGTADSVLMVESEAKMLSEDIMLGAVNFGHQQMQPVLRMIQELADEVNPVKTQIIAQDSSKIDQELAKIAESSLREAYKEVNKQVRYTKIEAIQKQATEELVNLGALELDIKVAFKHLQQHIVRRQIVETEKRIDGRSATEIRNICCEVSFLPRVHGSALFTRGETQVVAGTTLGSSSNEQLIDALEGESKEGFMLHYNFPPYSVGEATPSRAPGRREIGHGKLAWRAIHQVLPTKAEFPYSIRIVSEVTESNGSSSMATVCGGILSLMDAGVPIKAPVAGIAMGLILEKDKYVVLSDILGDEDHLGDMDFKVAGTENGVTALQMDIKVRGISSDIMRIALDQAKDGRLHILNKMKAALDAPRTSVNEFAPSIITMKISKDKIRDLIGPGGKVIKGICEETKTKIDIDDNGVVTIAAMGLESGNRAVKMVEDIAMEAEVNKIYQGKVVKLMEFGAFVNIGGKDGFLHISEIANEKIPNINDVLKESDVVHVKVIGFDQRGKVKLSMKVVDQATGAEIEGSSSSVAEASHHNNSERPASSRPAKSSSPVKRPAPSPKKEPEAPKESKRKYFS